MTKTPKECLKSKAAMPRHAAFAPTKNAASMRELMTNDEKFIFDSLYDLAEDFAKNNLTVYRTPEERGPSFDDTQEMSNIVFSIKEKFRNIVNKRIANAGRNVVSFARRHHTGGMCKRRAPRCCATSKEE